MPPEHFRCQRRIEQPHPHAAMFLGDQHARDAKFGERLPHIAGIGRMFIRRLAHAFQRRHFFERPSDAFLEQLLVFRQSEFHVPLLTLSPVSVRAACRARVPK